MFRRNLLGVCLVLALLAPAYGQYQYQRPNPNRGPQGQPAPVNAEGTVQGVSGSMVRMTANDKQWFVMVSPMTKIRLTGTALPDFLATKVYVEFVASLEADGKGKEKVSQLTIFSPSADRPSGLFPESAARRPSSGEGGPGRGPGGGGFGRGGGGGFGPDAGVAPDPGEAKGRKGRGKPPSDDAGGPGGFDAPAAKAQTSDMKLPATCTVRGLVTAFHSFDLSLNVKAGKKVVHVELTDAPQIDVDLADASLAKAGDTIKVTGRGIPAQGRVVAESVQIQAIHPLTTGKKHVAHSGKSEKPAPKTTASKKAGQESGEAKDSINLNGPDEKKHASDEPEEKPKRKTKPAADTDEK